MVEIGKLAVRTGIWPLKEYSDGIVRHTMVPSKRVAVEDYLHLQGRFRHLFVPVRNDDKLAALQLQVDDYWSHID
jgi:pyruvate ferredoxin oxidoreductase beta subunit